MGTGAGMAMGIETGRMETEWRRDGDGIETGWRRYRCGNRAGNHYELTHPRQI
jgi:hypothetical protein